MDILRAIYLKRKLHLVLFGLTFFIFAARLHDGPLRTYDECYYAGQAKEILITGDALTMHHALAENYENDPVYLWSMAAMFKCFGVSEFSARFPSALYGFFTVIAVFLTARLLRGYAFALSAALILATTWEFIRFSRYAHLDVCLSFFTAAAVYFFMKHELARCAKTAAKTPLFYSAMSGFCAGFAILSKNILGAFSIAAMAVYYLIRRDFRSLFGLNFALILLCAAAAPGAWYIYQYAANGAEFFSVHFGYILFKRAVNNPVEAAPVYQYFKILLLTYIPWLLLLVPGIYLIAKNFASVVECPARRDKDGLFFFSVIFIFLYIGVMSLSSAKKGWYIMPVYAQFALISAFALDRFFSRGGVSKKTARERSLKFISGGILFMLLCAFVIGIFPVRLYRTDNLEYKNEIAAFARSVPGTAYNKDYAFQPAGFDCDYFDYQLPLVFYAGIIPRHSLGAGQLKNAAVLKNSTLFSEREKWPSLLKTAGLEESSCEILLKTANFIIWKIK